MRFRYSKEGIAAALRTCRAFRRHYGQPGQTFKAEPPRNGWFEIIVWKRPEVGGAPFVQTVL